MLSRNSLWISDFSFHPLGNSGGVSGITSLSQAQFCLLMPTDHLYVTSPTQTSDFKLLLPWTFGIFLHAI